MLGDLAMSTIVVSDFGTLSRNFQVPPIPNHLTIVALLNLYAYPTLWKQKLEIWAIEPDQNRDVYSGVLRQVQKVGNPVIQQVARS